MKSSAREVRIYFVVESHAWLTNSEERIFDDENAGLMPPYFPEKPSLSDGIFLLSDFDLIPLEHSWIEHSSIESAATDGTLSRIIAVRRSYIRIPA